MSPTSRHQNSFLFFFLRCPSHQGYLLSCAESVANQSDTKPIPDCVRWLFTPLGRQFFLSCDWSVKSENTDEVYTSQREPGRSAPWSVPIVSCARIKSEGLMRLDVLPADPIAQLHRCFCRKLLERAVHTLIQPQSDAEAGKHKSDSG